MPKIRVEIEVPRDDCGNCRLLDEFGCCLLFEKELNHREVLDSWGFNDDIVECCEECKQAEVKDEHSSN